MNMNGHEFTQIYFWNADERESTQIIVFARRGGYPPPAVIVFVIQSEAKDLNQ